MFMELYVFHEFYTAGATVLTEVYLSYVLSESFAFLRFHVASYAPGFSLVALLFHDRVPQVIDVGVNFKMPLRIEDGC